MDRLLLCVGAAKSGTTWLYRNLRANSGLFFTPEKELNYFFSRHGAFDRLTPAIRARKAEELRGRAGEGAERERLDAWLARFLDGPPTPDWYRALFAGKPDGAWGADFSPSTSLVRPEGWAEAAGFAREVRLIYLMREPEARLWSHAKFHARFTGAAGRFRTMRLGAIERFVERSSLLVDGDYGSNLGRARAAVPPERILAIDYARIAAEPSAVLREVESFLGLGETPDPEGRAARPVNVTEAVPPPAGFGDRWRRRFRAETEALSALGVGFAAPWAALHAARPDGSGRLAQWLRWR